MTIFDSLRYTLSDNPTTEQLAAIPKPILKKWYKRYRSEKHMLSIPLEQLVADLRFDILAWGETPAERQSRIWHSILRKLKSWFQS